MTKILKKFIYIFLLFFYSISCSAVYNFNQLEDLIKNASGDSLKIITEQIHTYLDQCEKEKNPAKIAGANFLMGLAYADVDFPKATNYLEKSIQIATEINDSARMADAYFMLGMVNHFSFKNEVALENIYHALNYYLNNDNYEEQANAFYKLAMIYDDIDDSTNALRFYEKGLKLFIDQARNKEIAKVNHNIGVVYSKLNQNDKALEYYLESLNYFKKENYKIGIAAATNNIGVLYDKKGELENALNYYQNALKLYKELNQTRAIVIATFNVGETYKNQGNLKEAAKYFHNSLEMAKRNVIADYISNNYIELSEVYEEKGEFQKALSFHKLYFDINDSINWAENERIYSELESVINHDLTTKELELKTKKLNRKTLALYLFVFGAFLFSIVIALLYIEKRKNAKVNKELLDHKIHLEKMVMKKTKELEIEISERKVAEESDKLKSAFLANMSHEIRTPMNSIISFSRYLKDPDLTAEKRNEYIQYIISCGRNLLQLINDILDIAKIEAYKLTVRNDVCNVSNLLTETYEIFKESKVNNLKSIDLILNKFSLHDNITIESDYNRLKQVFTNLLENSFKYTNQGNIEFGIEKIRYNLIFFYVKDTGTGIPLNKSAMVFERFQQAEMSLEKKSRGAGLGLAICKNLVELMGGKIWLESKPDAGSVFRFTIPYKAPRIRNSSKYLKRDKSKMLQRKYEWDNKNILIAEDEELNFKVLEVALKKTGANIVRAKTGIEAVEKCKENNIDLILMDIQMPEMDGFQATRNIKQLSSYIPVIAQTSFAMAEDKQKCYEAGCNDFVTKPIDINNLLYKIDKHLKVKTI